MISLFQKWSSVLVMVAAVGCSGAPASETAGSGGGLGDGGSVSAGGFGGEDPTSPVCDCALASLGCGSALAASASESSCTIPLLPDHTGDLLACSDGEWLVQEACAEGCQGDTCVPVLPTVVMDELVVQSQVEPFRGDQPTLAGDLSVELVQKALGEEGFSTTVDGWFGNDTADTYSSWQIQLGYSGIGANGIPGPSSLAELGMDRFVIEHEILVGGQTSHSGKTINQRTKDMVAAAEALFGQGITVTQGSYNAGGVSASAGTHDGGGTIDVSVLSFNETQRWELIKALRTVGFAAWLRTPGQGNWPYHIHAVAVGDTDMSQSARNQVADYYVGLNGLASHAADNTPAAYQVPFTWWEQYRGP